MTSGEFSRGIPRIVRLRTRVPLEFTRAHTLGVVTAVLAALIPLAAWAWPAAIILALALAATLALTRPGVLLGFALNGFFVYLGILDLAGRSPRTRISGPYYAALGSLMLVAAWRRRDIALPRLRSTARLTRWWSVIAGLLAAWFLLNGVLYRAGGTESLRLMALLVLASLPAAILIFTFEAPQLEDLRRTIVSLGIVFAVSVIAAISAGRALTAGRFSPIAHLDPISAGLVPALAAVAALAGLRKNRGPRIMSVVIAAVLVATCAIAGSRGPLFALVGTALVAFFVVRQSAVWSRFCSQLSWVWLRAQWLPSRSVRLST